MRLHARKVLRFFASIVLCLLATYACGVFDRNPIREKAPPSKSSIAADDQKILRPDWNLSESDHNILRTTAGQPDKMEFTVPGKGQYERSVIWPDRNLSESDRIVNQLNFKPRWVSLREENAQSVILLYHGFGSWGVKKGGHTFREQKCLVDTCELTSDPKTQNSADAVLFRDVPAQSWQGRPIKQIWILFMLESPYHTASLQNFNNTFNWTATYRHDSDVVAPYEKFVLFNDNIRTLPQNRSYAAGKTKKVAWFVSRCMARNSRLDYAMKLSKFIDVDIYGACGKLECPRGERRCFDMLNKDYKFYLAFENSNCVDYITEKFFVTGLQNDIIPIVMGASPNDYAHAAPHYSFIHVDDFESPEKLAEYLHTLDTNDYLYNKYFEWKGTGRFINTFFWCRVCALLHDQSRARHVYDDLDTWWRGPNVCIGRQRWKDVKKTNIF